ncbi:MAG TPA: sodium ion-translocating decarboxylase subunit beta [Methanomicrobia archaeon]|nr:sodium ion-translocating decarboxylase subunit beta [Methanomicrobia archaeon]
MFHDLYITGIERISSLQVALIIVGIGLIVLAIKKKWEPYELLPLGFGIILTNLPLTYMSLDVPGQFGILYILSHYGIFWPVLPILIFVGLGAMTDFDPIIANPKLIFFGIAAQLGIFVAFIGAISLGFTPQEAASISIIGGADGPTTIFLTSRLAPHILGVTGVAAYTYIGMIPFIQPPISKALTSVKERKIRMKPLRHVSKTEKIMFPVITSIIVLLLVPQSGQIIGMFMFGNMLKVSGVVPRLSKSASNELTNLVTMFLCFSVGATLNAEIISTLGVLLVLGVFILGVVAVASGCAFGIIMAKIWNIFSKEKINPLIGASGVSAVPAAARVAQAEALKVDPENHILMYAMGPNVAGVIGSATVAGVFLAMLGGL